MSQWFTTKDEHNLVLLEDVTQIICYDNFMDISRQARGVRLWVFYLNDSTLLPRHCDRSGIACLPACLPACQPLNHTSAQCVSVID